MVPLKPLLSTDNYVQWLAFLLLTNAGTGDPTPCTVSESFLETTSMVGLLFGVLPLGRS